MSTLLRTLLLSFITFLLITAPLSCQSDMPKDVLPAEKMENVLYDYHIAQSLAQQTVADSIDFYTRLYQAAVFKKYGIQKADFDRSMQWYERHIDKLKKIYEHLAERLGGDASATSTLANKTDGAKAIASDTLNIWHGPTTTLLNSQNVNRFKYTMRPDTALHAGDQLQWSFNVNWFYHDGERRIVAYAVIHYEGDSTAIMQKFVYSSGPQATSLTIGKRKVTSIDCYIYQCAPWSEKVRIATITQLQMNRLRVKNQDGNNNGLNANDTINKQTLPRTQQMRLRDSLMHQDSANERRSHFI